MENCFEIQTSDHYVLFWFCPMLLLFLNLHEKSVFTPDIGIKLSEMKIWRVLVEEGYIELSWNYLELSRIDLWKMLVMLKSIVELFVDH